MREIFGMIIGCALTILVVYLHDNNVSTASTNNPPASSRMIVNWDVAASEWAHWKHNASVAWDKLRGDVEKMKS
jgi:hypothetical protein